VLMLSILKVIKGRYLDPSILRWGIVGISTALLDYITFLCLYSMINSVFVANLISGSIATSINYLSHYRWTFRSDRKHSNSGFKYLLNWFFWWLVSTTAIKLLIVSNFDPKLAKLIPIIFIAPISYVVLKLIVFRGNFKNL
jgi:putative flippase GtrA